MQELTAFQQRLEKHAPHFTRSEQRIAEYLLANYDHAAFLPAAELAQQLEVSEATIVRFARAIGYAGFPEMRRSLQDIFRARVTPATRLQRKLADLGSGQHHIFTQIVEMERQYLAEAENNIVPADFDRAVKLILKGERIFVRGGGPSAILADLAELRLRRFGILTISMTESGRDLIEKLQLVRRKDVVLTTGFHRVSAELAAVIEHANRVGCRTILITDTLASVFRDKVDVILAARRGPVSTFHSLTVPMAILNALILAVAMARSKESLGALDRFQKMRAAYGLDMNGKVNTS